MRRASSTRRRRAAWVTRVACVALAVLVLLTAASCAVPGGGREDAWAVEAEEWIEAWTSQDAGSLAEARFYSSSVVIDATMVDGARLEGRTSLLLHSDRRWQQMHRVGPGEAYLDAHGFVSTWDRVYDAGFTSPVASVAEMPPNPNEGIARLTFLRNNATAADPDAGHAPFVRGQTLAEQTAEQYVRAWSQTDFLALRHLYAADATITDSVHGVDVRGREAIVALADPRTATRMRLARVGDLHSADVLRAAGASPDARGVYVLLTPDRDGHLGQLLLLQRSVRACPGASAVLLSVDAGQITAERRFHRLSAVRSCADVENASVGWWDDRELPAPLSERVTGTVESTAGTIEVRNGTPELEVFVTWAINRFGRAGLPAPPVTSIAFDPLHERCGCCRGYSRWVGDSTAVLICADASGVAWTHQHDDECPGPPYLSARPYMRDVMLHELAHAWLHAYLAPQQRDAFLQHVGLTTWDDPRVPWDQRGVEWATEAMAWGLRGEPHPMPLLGNPPCLLLSQGYEMLTGAQPLTSCDSD